VGNLPGNNQAAASIVLQRRVNILVDLMGYTVGGRPQLFVARLAPIQVSYLGYPHTTGAEYMDYIICDAVACPMEMEAGWVCSTMCEAHCHASDQHGTPQKCRVCAVPELLTTSPAPGGWKWIRVI